MGKVEEIDARLNGQGRVILEEANNTGLELALACALVEQESGGRNIFGCDHGDVGDTPPYCHQQVTRDRVQRLRDGGNYTFGMNGVGLTQLTWWEIVERAEAEGGAHLPEAQCRVGFRLLKHYVDAYPYLEALGAYNAGEGNRQVGIDNGYAGALAAKHEAWKGILTPEVEETFPEVNLVPNEDGWLADPEAGKWARVRDLPNGVVHTDKDGWLRVSSPTP